MNLSPRPSTSRGFKGLFWRSRFNPSEISEVATAEPAKLQRNTLGDPLRSKAALPLKDGQLQEEQDVNSQKEYAGNRRETRSRPALADSACPNCRFIPSLPPAIQKGENGRWQPPLLYRGSLSTSALSSFAEDDAHAGSSSPANDKQEVNRKKGHKHSLSILFGPSRFGAKGLPAARRQEEECFAIHSPLPDQSKIVASADISFNELQPVINIARPSMTNLPPPSPTPVHLAYQNTLLRLASITKHREVRDLRKSRYHQVHRVDYRRHLKYLPRLFCQ